MAVIAVDCILALIAAWLIFVNVKRTRDAKAHPENYKARKTKK